MKKLLSIALALCLMLSMASCGSKTSETETLTPAEQKKESGVFFKNDVLKIEDGIIEIKKVELLGPSSDGEKDRIAFEFEFTNTSDEPLSPSTVWIACMDLTQEDDTTVKDIEVGWFDEDDKYWREKDFDPMDEVKPEGVVTDTICYELELKDKPVKLIASQGMMGDELGEKIYEVEKK